MILSVEPISLSTSIDISLSESKISAGNYFIIIFLDDKNLRALLFLDV